MPEVIVDTSPLQYLHQLELLDLLPDLYGKILIPESVVREIAAGHALGVALPELKTLRWIEVRRVAGLSVLPLVFDLGAGERDVLALALEAENPLVVLDDALARRVAKRLELAMTGTLGLLLKAKQAGRIARLEPLLDRLEDLHFRLDGETRSSVLRLAGEFQR
jgi:predicted nucleic acid-binding protein